MTNDDPYIAQVAELRNRVHHQVQHLKRPPVLAAAAAVSGCKMELMASKKEQGSSICSGAVCCGEKMATLRTYSSGFIFLDFCRLVKKKATLKGWLLIQRMSSVPCAPT